MSPIPSPGNTLSLQFVQSLTSAASPLRNALDALSANASDPRITRKAHNAIRVAITAQLAGKADYDTVATIAQDTSLRVLNAASKGKPLTVAFVRECARNLLTDHIRSVTRQKRDGSSYIPDATAEWDKPIEHVEVLEKLSELPWEMGNVLALRFLEDLTLQQVADKLDLSLSKVHRLEKQGLRQMESLLTA
jgi:RNA polymerase sigma-70 factor (ECF subfamily)